MAASHHICDSNKSKDGTAREGVFSRTVKFHHVELIVAANACWQVMQAREDRPATVAAAPVWPGQDVGSAASAPQTAVFCCSRCAAPASMGGQPLSLPAGEADTCRTQLAVHLPTTPNLSLPHTPDNSWCLLSKCKVGHKFYCNCSAGPGRLLVSS